MRAPLVLLCAAVALAVAAVKPANASAALSWSAPTLIDNQQVSSNFAGVSCASADLCVAVDLAGNVVVSTDPTGGAGAWTTTNVDGSNSLYGVSCPSVSLCVATDSVGNVITSTDPTGGAGAWTTTNVDGSSLYGVSCPSTALCVAVDGTGHALTSTKPTGGAGAWRTTSRIAPTGYHERLSGVSCASLSLCVAVGAWGAGPPLYTVTGNLVTSTNPTGGAGAWKQANIGGGYLSEVSCPSALLCVAAHQSGGLASSTNPTGGAGAWTTANIDGGRNVLLGVSCPSASLCVAFDDAGNVITSTNPTGGTSAWHVTKVEASPNALVSVSCPSSSLCFAVDMAGNVVVGHVGPIGPSVQQIQAQLLKELAPRGKAAKIADVLKRGGYVLSFKALIAGKAAVAWYYLPKGAHISNGKPKSVLVATAKKTLTKAGPANIAIKLTTTGKQLLKHAQHLKLTAKAIFTPIGRHVILATKTFTLTR